MSSTTLASYHMTPEYPFFLPPAEEDYASVRSGFANDTPPFVVQDQFLGGLDVPTVHSFGDTTNVVLQDPCSLWLLPTPSLTDSGSVSSPSSDTPWAEDLTSPTYPTPGVYTQDPFPSGSVTGPTFQPELPWHEKPGQCDITAPPHFTDDSSWGAQSALDHSTGSFGYTSFEGATLYPSEWSLDQLYRPALDGAAAAVQAPPMSSSIPMSAVPGTILGKRPREDEDTHDDIALSASDGHQQRPCKKGKHKMGTNEVLESTGTASNARNKPALRTSANNYGKSKTVGRGAGRLAPTTAQGVYHQSLLGPSDQQVLVGTTAPGQLTWIEESVEGRSRHHHSSVVQKAVEVQRAEHNMDDESANAELFSIPRRLDARHRALLVATPADWQRKAVDELKCRLCPGADFGNWDDFKRHCDTSEAHPARISYCNHCGDFFARSDALKRHRSKRPAECISVTEEAAEFKRTETARVFEEFKAELERCLTTDEEVTTSFSRTIKDMFPDSSKRGSREQSRKLKSQPGH